MHEGAVCFTMSVVDEFPLAGAALSRLRTVYPDAVVVLLVDGDAEAVMRWQYWAGPGTVVLGAHGSYRT